MRTFRYTSSIPASVETVWDFHERPDALQRLTPPWQPVQIVRQENGLAVGAEAEYAIQIGSVPVRWVARQIECRDRVQFVEEQIDGPMEFWRHYHQFESLSGGGTRLTDRIDYQLPGGLTVELALGWWVDARLHDMFRYRHEVTQRACRTATNPV